MLFAKAYLLAYGSERVNAKSIDPVHKINFAVKIWGKEAQKKKRQMVSDKILTIRNQCFHL